MVCKRYRWDQKKVTLFLIAKVTKILKQKFDRKKTRKTNSIIIPQWTKSSQICFMSTLQKKIKRKFRIKTKFCSKILFTNSMKANISKIRSWKNTFLNWRLLKKDKPIICLLHQLNLNADPKMTFSHGMSIDYQISKDLIRKFRNRLS